MSNLLFLGSYFPKELVVRIQQDSFGAIANANNQLQHGFIQGLDLLNIEYSKFTYPQIGAFPSKYRHLFFQGNLELSCGSFCNLVGLKHFHRYFLIKKKLKISLLDLTDTLTVIVYDLNIPYLLALSKLKRENNLHICLIVPDLYGYTGNSHSLVHRVWSFFEKKFLFKALNSVDSFVLLSEFMLEKLPTYDKPTVVIEGIYSSVCPLRVKEKDRKMIFYSGAIDKRNGILNLLQAFSLILDIEYKLIICGDGPEKEAVLLASKADSRIIYKGQIPHEEVLKLQVQSSLLVNPRTSKGDFTKYSFPSKTLEYFASGTPVLMYKLDGVPSEYYNYCYTLDDESVEALCVKILEIHELGDVLNDQLGSMAKDFILSNKTPLVQVSKLVKMLGCIW